MMRKNVWLAIALVTILPVMLFMASCSAKKMVQTEPVSKTETEAQKTPDRPAEVAEQVKENRLPEESVAREVAKTALVKENVHFAFDSSILSDQAKQILNSKAEYLRMNPDITITVEGHCDERGTDAYNTTLGERRAESVKIFLVNLGIDTNRLHTVSYGKERPIAKGHDEATWAKNRRAQFVIN